MRHKWTPEQEQFVIDNWQKLSDRQMSNRLGIRWTKIASRRQKLGLHKGHKASQVKAPNAAMFDVREFECWITGGPRSMEPQTIARRQAA